jgi:hypothetical protein
VTRVPASPSAAGISELPRTPAPATASPADFAAAEASVRRVALFATDLSAELQARPPIAERSDMATPATSDAQRWGRQAAYFTVFEAPSGAPAAGGVRLAVSSAIRFAAEDGARAQMNVLSTVHVNNVSGLSADRLLPPGVTLDPAEWSTAPPPAVGEEALAWRRAGSAGEPAGMIVAFRRKAIVVVLLTIGDADTPALARTLDGRAMAAQQ